MINIVGGQFVVGNNFSSNSGLKISCGKSICVGDNCAIGWDVTIIDGDGHHIFSDNAHIWNDDRAINIGNHVWLCARVTCLKGTFIPDNCVVGYGKIVTNAFIEKSSLICDENTSKIKHIYRWEI